jgi:hypothetical protein
MKFIVKTIDNGLLIVPATSVDAIELDKLKAAAVQKAEEHARARRAEWFTSGAGKPLTDLRAKLDLTEDTATALASRVREQSEALQMARATGDTAMTSALETKIGEGKATLDQLRGQCRDLRHAVDRLDVSLRNSLKEFIAQTRAEFKAMAEARMLAELDGLNEVLASVTPEAAIEAAEALAGDARINRLVQLPARDGMPGRKVELVRLLSGTRSQDIPPLTELRPIRREDVWTKEDAERESGHVAGLGR